MAFMTKVADHDVILEKLRMCEGRLLIEISLNAVITFSQVTVLFRLWFNNVNRPTIPKKKKLDGFITPQSKEATCSLYF